jgi:Leucine-rich repeat (LRR) protein
MKNLILSAFLMLFGFLQAQIINIPDVNFKAKLLSSNTTTSVVARDENYQPIIIDTNNNNEIEISEALQVHYLFVYNSNIASLTGIEFFTNLQTLSCQNNLLTTLNISSLTNLN